MDPLGLLPAELVSLPMKRIGGLHPRIWMRVFEYLVPEPVHSDPGYLNMDQSSRSAAGEWQDFFEDREDLRSLCLVNKHFDQMARPLLMRNVFISNEYATLGRLLELLVSRPELVKYIRSFQTDVSDNKSEYQFEFEGWWFLRRRLLLTAKNLMRVTLMGVLAMAENVETLSLRFAHPFDTYSEGLWKWFINYDEVLTSQLAPRFSPAALTKINVEYGFFPRGGSVVTFDQFSRIEETKFTHLLTDWGAAMPNTVFSRILCMPRNILRLNAMEHVDMATFLDGLKRLPSFAPLTKHLDGLARIGSMAKHLATKYLAADAQRDLAKLLKLIERQRSRGRPIVKAKRWTVDLVDLPINVDLPWNKMIGEDLLELNMIARQGYLQYSPGDLVVALARVRFYGLFVPTTYSDTLEGYHEHVRLGLGPSFELYGPELQTPGLECPRLREATLSIDRFLGLFRHFGAVWRDYARYHGSTPGGPPTNWSADPSTPALSTGQPTDRDPLPILLQSYSDLLPASLEQLTLVGWMAAPATAHARIEARRRAGHHALLEMPPERGPVHCTIGLLLVALAPYMRDWMPRLKKMVLRFEGWGSPRDDAWWREFCHLDMPEVPRGVFDAVKKPLDTLIDAYKAVDMEVAFLVAGDWYCDGIMNEDHPDHDDDCHMNSRFRDDEGDGDGGDGDGGDGDCGGDDCSGDDGGSDDGGGDDGGDADPAEGSNKPAKATDPTKKDPAEGSKEPATAQDQEDPTEEEEEVDPAADCNLAYEGDEGDWSEHDVVMHNMCRNKRRKKDDEFC
ncbi:hypothetical protein B0T26DRAFT_678784 [Lasiosphaeria miniovina]|uniref:Uncharacterized protein n=1 Tax=Lasiosphaeria miniovina TaxID=1954250 RepID=A0AA40A4Y2_9PEZI|nr:uncharacterized protein B0T26DRAFT_678784 [Lasiosphaeria miniovina]KAK0709347.1 hypothetical protein B0T26DRAFT_678784 [Lasiosphaeria miniovina]